MPHTLTRTSLTWREPNAFLKTKCSFSHDNSRHPDKSDNPLAETKFVEIKKAYELLSDTERRNAYDLHGVTHEDAFASRTGHDYSQYGRFASDPFEEFFGYVSHNFIRWISRRSHFGRTIILMDSLSVFSFLFPFCFVVTGIVSVSTKISAFSINCR